MISFNSIQYNCQLTEPVTYYSIEYITFENWKLKCEIRLDGWYFLPVIKDVLVRLFAGIKIYLLIQRYTMQTQLYHTRSPQ